MIDGVWQEDREVRRELGRRWNVNTEFVKFEMPGSEAEAFAEFVNDEAMIVDILLFDLAKWYMEAVKTTGLRHSLIMKKLEELVQNSRKGG